MQLAEALLIRADQNKKILSLRARIAHNALAQEGDAPQEDVATLLAECFAVIEQQRVLVQRINAANASARLPDGRLLAQVLGERDALAQRHAVMTQAVEACTRFAFGPAALHRVEANVMPRNTASLRVLKKCGYRPEGLARRYLRINGAWEDHIHMVRLNEPDKG